MLRIRHQNNSLSLGLNHIKKRVSVHLMSLDNDHCFVDSILKKKKNNLLQLNLKKYKRLNGQQCTGNDKQKNNTSPIQNANRTLSIKKSILVKKTNKLLHRRIKSQTDTIPSHKLQLNLNKIYNRHDIDHSLNTLKSTYYHNYFNMLQYKKQHQFIHDYKVFKSKFITINKINNNNNNNKSNNTLFTINNIDFNNIKIKYPKINNQKYYSEHLLKIKKKIMPIQLKQRQNKKKFVNNQLVTISKPFSKSMKLLRKSSPEIISPQQIKPKKKQRPKQLISNKTTKLAKIDDFPYLKQQLGQWQSNKQDYIQSLDFKQDFMITFS